MAAPVLILEDDRELSGLLRELFESNGAEVLVAETVAHLMLHDQRALRSRVAFLDIELGHGQPSGIDAYIWLSKNGFTGNIYFLTGHGHSHPLVCHAKTVGDVEVLSKPVSAKILLDIVNGGRS